MQDFGDILDNSVLFIAVIACLIAQASKLLIELCKNRKLNVRVLVTTGGMPSSHSALVTALATGVGQTSGWASPEFAIATVFAVIVMYDAAGGRQGAGIDRRDGDVAIEGAVCTETRLPACEHFPLRQ